MRTTDLLDLRSAASFTSDGSPDAGRALNGRLNEGAECAPPPAGPSKERSSSVRDFAQQEGG